jgi:hypothetical protein
MEPTVSTDTLRISKKERRVTYKQSKPNQWIRALAINKQDQGTSVKKSTGISKEKHREFVNKSTGNKYTGAEGISKQDHWNKHSIENYFTRVHELVYKSTGNYYTSAQGRVQEITMKEYKELLQRDLLYKRAGN